MKGIGFKLIPIIVLVFFITVMTTGAFLKQPLFNGDDVIYHIEKVKESVQEENWKTAKSQLDKAQKAWEKVVLRIQFSAEREEINMLKRNLERTRGFIIAEDKGGAIAELTEAEFFWTELGK